MARHRGGRLTVRITGLARLRMALEALPEEIRAELREAVRVSAEAVRDDARRNVPVGATKGLRDGVSIRYSDDDFVAQVGWFDPKLYYARFVEYGTYRMPARPSLGPALEAGTARLSRALLEALR